MTLHFFVICFGVLGCYAVFRTTRRGWVRFAVLLLVFMGSVQLGFDAMFPHVPGGGDAGSDDKYFGGKLTQLENDRCMMSHLRDSPLSPIAYVLEMHRFLSEYKRLQTPAHAKEDTLANFSRIFDEAFTDDVTPGEATVAVAQTDGSLCDKFTRWTEAHGQLQGMSIPGLPAAPSPSPSAAAGPIPMPALAPGATDAP